MIWILAALGIFLIVEPTVMEEIVENLYNTDPFYRWDSLIEKYCKIYDVPFSWAKAIMMTESSLGQDPRVQAGLMDPENIEASKSGDGKSWGLNQLTLSTARMFAPTVEISDLNDPDTNQDIATQYMAYLIRLKGLNGEAFARSYNGGPGYAGTLQGQRDTPAYYQKWLKNLKTIQERS